MKIDVKNLNNAYNAEAFEVLALKTITILRTYLSTLSEGGLPVASYKDPEHFIAEWQGLLAQTGNTSISELATIIEKTIEQSIHLHHPNFVGHQVSAPLPLASLCDLVSSMLNNGAAVYEMGPLATALEACLVKWMSTKLGWDESSSGGFFTSGGSLGNLTALLAMRQFKCPGNQWEDGASADRFAVLVSSQSHYCVKRAVQIMGWGAKGAIPVAVDERFRMDLKALERAFETASADGRKVVAVVASCCSTATGSFDPLEEIVTFCQKHSLWLHVDGAHGASLALSDKFNGVLKGIEHADSLVWDAHKMMMMPALTTAVLFKNSRHSFAAFNQEASYIYDQPGGEDLYNLGQRTIECTKHLMALKLFVCLQYYGEAFFRDYVDSRIELTHAFYEVLQEDSEFETPHFPECNILCFRYLPVGGSDDIDRLQERIRQDIIDEGSYYLVKTKLHDKTFLRVTIINPLTTLSDLQGLVSKIKEFGSQVK